MANLKFCEGIGDTNPLWLDPEYAAKGPYKGVVAPPSWVFCCYSTIQFGWPGTGAFHSATEMHFERPVRKGDVVYPKCVYDGFSGPSPSKFAGRSVTDYLSTVYKNQRGEEICRTQFAIMHYERGERLKKTEAQPAKAEVLPHPWTLKEIEDIEKEILAEKPRGSDARYWEDVSEGDALCQIIKGPIGITDEVAFVASGAAPIPRVAAHRAALQKYDGHPAWAFRDPDTMAQEPIYAVHYNIHAAQAMGVALQYDVGVQRHCWQIHLLTDWMGDTAWLKSCQMSLRKFVYFGDVVRLGGKVIGKRVDDDGTHLVDVVTFAMNQRGDNVMPGKAVIALPSRSSKQTPAELAAQR